MNKSLLLVVLILLAAVASYLVVQQEQSTPIESQLLFEDLAANANAINRVTLENQAGTLFSAQLLDGNWSVTHISQVSGYPAEQASLSELITALMQTERLEAKTAKAENHARLGLSAITEQDSQATLVTLSSGTKSWGLLVGNTASSYVGSYVRLPNQNQTWLLDKSIELPAEDASWLKQPILDIAEEQISSVEKAGEEGWKLVKNAESGGFVLDSLPAGRELRYESILDGIAGNIADLRFDDLQTWDQAFWQSLQPEAELTLALNESDNLTVSLAKLDDEHYARFESVSLSGYWQNWIYKLSSFSAGQLNKSLEDFLTELPEEQDAGSASLDEGEAPQE